MNEKILEEILTWLNSTRDFLNSEIPLVIQEYIVWGYWKSVIASTALIIPLIFLLIAAYWFYLKFQSDNQNYPPPWLIGTGFCIFLAFIAFMVIIEEGAMAIKTQVAPRAYLIDKFVGMK